MPPFIESIRAELRIAIYQNVLSANEETSPATLDFHQQRACSFIHFGARTHLLSDEEANDWLDAVWGRLPVPAVASKYEVPR